MLIDALLPACDGFSGYRYGLEMSVSSFFCYCCFTGCFVASLSRLEFLVYRAWFVLRDGVFAFVCSRSCVVM